MFLFIIRLHRNGLSHHEICLARRLGLSYLQLMQLQLR